MDSEDLIARGDAQGEDLTVRELTLNLSIENKDIGKTERTCQVTPSNNLQFITITDPRQCQIPKHKRIVRSQAMRYARGQVRSVAPKRGISIQSTGYPSTPVSGKRCPHIQPSGTTPCSCTMSNKVPGFRGGCQGENTDLVAGSSSPHSPVSLLGSGRVDPFGSFPIFMTDYMHFLVDYYTHIASRVQLPRSKSISPLTLMLIPLARSNEAVLQSLLCLAASRVTIDSGGHIPRQWEIYHRGEAIRLIQAQLSDLSQATSDEMITTICLLSGHDILFGHYEEYDIHMQGLERIIAAKGGMDKLRFDGVLRMLVSWASHFRKNPKKGRMPEKSSLVPAPGERSNALMRPRVSCSMDDTRLALIPLGFRKAAQKGLIGPELYRLINTLCSLVVQMNDVTQLTLADAITFSDRRINMEQDLEALLPDPPGISSENIEQCCVLAILIYDYITMRAMPPTAAPQMEMSRDLKVALERTSLNFHDTESKLILWILFIGYVSSHMHGQKSWFASTLKELFPETNHKDVHSLKKTLRDFLYSEAHFEKPYAELWSWLAPHALNPQINDA